MRNSDLLLDDFDKEQQSYVNEKKKNRCFQSAGVAFVLVSLLAVVGFFAFSGAKISQEETSGSPAPFLRSPHLCDTCHMNPEVDGDYVLCSSCGFEPSNDKTLKCPKGYGNMFVTKAHIGREQSALIEGKIYTHCKEEMVNGGASCNLNLLELVPEIDDLVPPPRPEPRGGKAEWMKKKQWGMPPSPFGFEAWDIMPFDDLPMGPNGESMLDDAMEEDQAILEALDQEPEITSMEHLFLAMPHEPSLKLEKALMKCMEIGNKKNKIHPTCAGGATLLKCRGQDKDNAICVNKIEKGPICSDGTKASCPDTFDFFKKGSRCMPESGEGVPVRHTCGDGNEAKRCKKKGPGGLVKPECQKANGKPKKGMKVFCKDGSKPTCPAGYIDKKDMPKCVADSETNPVPKAHEICADESEPVFCKVDGVINNLCLDATTGKKMKHMKKACADGTKPECPTGYSKGPCVSDNVNNGESARAKAECGADDRVIHCHRKKFRVKFQALCGTSQKPMCEKAAVAAQCPNGYTLDPEKFPAEIFLSRGIDAPRHLHRSIDAPKHHHKRFVGEEAYRLPHGPHGESLLPHACPEDQPIIDALMDAPEIQNVDQLFDVIPDGHEMSFKLSRALIKCMNPDDITDVMGLQCEEGEEILKGCKGVKDGDALFDACQFKKEQKKAGKRTPMCTNMKFATCPENYESYSKSPPCISTDEQSRVSMVCASGEPALDCKRKKNKKKPACALKKKRFVCPDGDKPTCPASYSRGQCKNEAGERAKAKCSFDEAKKEKPVKCHKPKNAENPLCADTKGPMCESTTAAPICPDGYGFNFSAYRTDLDVDETTALVLNAPRPPRGSPHRGPHGRPPFGGKGPKGEVSVDFLCLKVDLN